MDIGILGGVVSGIFFLMLSTLAFFVWAPLPFLEEGPGDEIDRLLAEDHEAELHW